jgi:hypothetical protein
MSESVKEKIIYPRDTFLAVKDIDISGMTLHEVMKLIQSKSMETNCMVKM